ncbi:MAG: HD-GYP domain-containing protein [Candidatus Hydrogenedentota bacterium]
MAHLSEYAIDLHDAGPDGFCPVLLNTFRRGGIVNFDLFIRQPGGAAPGLYHEAARAFGQDAREDLAARKINELWMRHEDRPHLCRYVEEHLSAIRADTGMPLEVRAALLYETAQELVKEVLQSPRSRTLLNRAATIAQHMVRFLSCNTGAFSCLAQCTWRTYETYTHCVDVCVFASGLAAWLGFKDDKAFDIALGALIHDIGKSEIDPEILRRNGPLSDQEWQVIHQHPIWGEQMLRDTGITNRVVLEIVRHHHEKLSGDGYPDALPGAGIRMPVRIVTIADIFSALTAKRPFGERMGSYDALRLMSKTMGHTLDRSYLRQFVKLLGQE